MKLWRQIAEWIGNCLSWTTVCCGNGRRLLWVCWSAMAWAARNGTGENANISTSQPREWQLPGRLARPPWNGRKYCSTLWLLCLCWLPGLYLTVPIKTVTNKTWERHGLGVCVCVWTAEVAVLLRQLSVCLRAALVRVVTQTGIIIECVTFLMRSFPCYADWCQLSFFLFLSNKEKKSPIKTSLKNEKKIK